MAGTHGTKAIIAAFFANLGLSIAKFVAYIFTGSATMLAESIHSLADTSNQALLFWGGRRAVRAPDERFQFGYARERYFWAFVVALVLFSLGGLFSMFEGYEKIRHPEPIESAGWAFSVLIIGIVLEGWSFRTAVHESRALKGDRSWWGFIRTARTPELPVVLLEDLGALVGLILALIAISLSIIFDAPVWDAVGTISIGVLLVAIAVTLAIEMKGLLIGESARPVEDAKIRAAIAASPHVERLIHMRTQHLGPQELLVGAKVEFHDTLTADEVANAINEVEAAVRAVVPHARPMYIEPDFVRTGTADGSTAEAKPGVATEPPTDTPH
jgi:cation diffusion facilitator family transporter